MDDNRDKNWMDVADEGDNQTKINALRWEVYFIDSEELIKRQFLVYVPNPKGGHIVQTCVKDHIIEGKEDYEAIGLSEFDYRLFEEQEGGGNREELDGYTYLKHLIHL